MIIIVNKLASKNSHPRKALGQHLNIGRIHEGGTGVSGLVERVLPFPDIL